MYTLIETYEEAEQAIELIKNYSDIVGVDTETTGLDWFTDDIILVQVAVGDDKPIFDVRKLGYPFLKELVAVLNTKKCVLHNAKFDMKFLYNRTGIWLENVHCTMICESVLNAGREGIGLALGNLVEKYAGEIMNKESRMDFVNLPPEAPITMQMLTYSALDVAYLVEIYKEQMTLVVEAKEQSIIDMEMKLVPVVAEMEFTGVKLDADAWTKLEAINRGKLVNLTATFKEYVIDELIVKLAEKNLTALGFAETIKIPIKTKKLKQVLEGITDVTNVRDWLRENFNVNSSTQMKAVLNLLGVKVENTNEKTLYPHAGKEVVSKLLAIREVAKQVSTYGLKFLENINSTTGRVHTEYFTGGTACLPKGELVLTNRGYIPVETVHIGDKVINHNGKEDTVSDTFQNGVRYVLLVKLNNGLSLRCTDNHQFYTDGGKWIQATDLLFGDSILVHTNEECWKEIKGWEDFSVSSWGRVINNKTKYYIKQIPKGTWGHLKVQLYRNGSQSRGDDRKDFSVHRIVADAFCDGKSITRKEVRHLDGIAWNNNVLNLVWGTTGENRLDAVKHGTMQRRNSKQRKLTLSDVLRIKKSTGMSHAQLATNFGVSRRLVGMIRSGERWSDTREDQSKTVSFFSSFVVSVDRLSEEMTYGMEVEKDHSHVTSGIVTHNTGRFSSSHPNLQNIPTQGGFRECFVPEEGYSFISCDYSQQEYRLSGAISRDDVIINAYKNGSDMHTATAAIQFGIPFSEVKKEQRNVGKTMNFAILYGSSEWGLHKNLKVPVEKAKEMITKFFEGYPKLSAFKTMAEARILELGYSCTPMGRRRYNVPKPMFTDSKQFVKWQEQVKREGFNLIIQGGGADILKLAMINIAVKNPWGDKFRMLLQIHDELMVEVHNSIKEEALLFIETEMRDAEQPFLGEIPAVVEGRITTRWEK